PSTPSFPTRRSSDLYFPRKYRPIRRTQRRLWPGYRRTPVSPAFRPTRAHRRRPLVRWHPAPPVTTDWRIYVFFFRPPIPLAGARTYRGQWLVIIAWLYRGSRLTAPNTALWI